MPSDSTATKCELNAEEVTIVRRALLIGLESYGEIRRVQNAAELCKLGNEPIHEDIVPRDPTGSADTVCDFAYALRALEHAEAPHD